MLTVCFDLQTSDQEGDVKWWPTSPIHDPSFEDEDEAGGPASIPENDAEVSYIGLNLSELSHTLLVREDVSAPLNVERPLDGIK